MGNILKDIANSARSILKGLGGGRKRTELLDELLSDDSTTESEAIAALLVEIAMIDQEFSKEEYEFIFRFFRENYELEEREIWELVRNASTRYGNYKSTGAFSSHLAETMDKKERQKVLNAMGELIKVDGVEHGFELFVKSRMEELLKLK